MQKFYFQHLHKEELSRMKISILQQLDLLLSIFVLILIKSSIQNKQVHSRQKRILWVTTDGRLALPPGTTLVITPSLSLPFVRYPPDGFFSNMTVSLPFTIDFNKLGLTDNENPFGVVPPVLARSMGRAAGNILADYIGEMFEHRRNGNRKYKKKRSIPEPPAQYKHAFHGGERALLYLIIEEFLENFGLDGKACVLRAICEVQAHPMKNFGLFGEILKMFFSASKSPYAHMLKEYVDAENAGRGNMDGPAECWPYMKDCPKSLFQTKHNYYNNDDNNEIDDDDDDENDKVTYDPAIKNI